MPPRRPTPARSSTSLPSLATILATAAVAEGCAPMECGGERIDELAAHGPRGAEALGRWNVSQGLREVAVAVGALRHDTRVPSVSVGGAPAARDPDPGARRRRSSRRAGSARWTPRPSRSTRPARARCGS